MAGPRQLPHDEDVVVASANTTDYVFNPSALGLNDGGYSIRVNVDDGDGDSASAETAVMVLNVAPTPNAGGPYDDIYEGDDHLVLDASATTDPSPQDETNLLFEWDLDNDGDYDDATGEGPTIPWAALQTLGIRNDGTYNPACVSATTTAPRRRPLH